MIKTDGAAAIGKAAIAAIIGTGTEMNIAADGAATVRMRTAIQM